MFSSSILTQHQQFTQTTLTETILHRCHYQGNTVLLFEYEAEYTIKPTHAELSDSTLYKHVMVNWGRKKKKTPTV